MEKNTAQGNGALLIHKEAGVTSFDVIRSLRRRSIGLPREAQRAKWGHSGTLDPFATGVLIVLLGHATRLQDELHLLPKTYRAVITLGATSDTDDATGKIVIASPAVAGRGNLVKREDCFVANAPRNDTSTPTKQQILSALDHIKNQTSQIPPTYAAIKVAGKKLYEYARKGESVERKARPITIHDIVLENYAYPTLEISVTCSTGTYIRSIARDIGDMLGTGAYCSVLSRSSIGPFVIENSYVLKDLPEDLQSAIIPLEQLVSHIASITYADANVAKLKTGREVEAAENTPVNAPIALLDENKKLFGIGIRETEANLIKPKKIFL